jgi:endonuclease YncB( thermonuclease family)
MLFFLVKFISRRIRSILVSAVAVALTAGFNHAFAAAPIQGRVVGVSDGDTITVLDANKQQHRIRFKGIDAPESKQAFGNVSKAALSDLVYRKQVTVMWTEKDRYGRVLGTVMLDGTDINLRMISQGNAWHYKQYASSQSAKDRAAYASAEAAARSTGKGLWRDPDPVPPWDFRRQKRSADDQDTASVELGPGLVFIKTLLAHGPR